MRRTRKSMRRFMGRPRRLNFRILSRARLQARVEGRNGGSVRPSTRRFASVQDDELGTMSSVEARNLISGDSRPSSRR